MVEVLFYKPEGRHLRAGFLETVGASVSHSPYGFIVWRSNKLISFILFQIIN
jgi:hypothetical protein